jgi:hypothetical protein
METSIENKDVIISAYENKIRDLKSIQKQLIYLNSTFHINLTNIKYYGLLDHIRNKSKNISENVLNELSPKAIKLLETTYDKKKTKIIGS